MRSIADKKDIHAGIHQTRRHLKILRAILRLIRFEISPDLYHAENHFYRDLARELSFGRDLTSMLETIESLIKGDIKEKNKPALIILRDQILSQRHDYLQSHQQSIRNVSKSLSDHPVHTTKMEWSAKPRINLIQSLHLSYGRSFKSQKMSLKDPSVENLHEWRKRAKYLRYQLLIIRNAWSSLFKVWESELHRLTDLLGQSNNLAVLEKYLNKTDNPALLKDINELIQSRQVDLIHAAHELGAKLFAEKPDAFKRRISIYLSQWSAFD